MSFDRATLAAFVDGELDDLTARRIEREAESDAALATEIARHRALKAQLTAHYDPVIDEAVPERLRALLATSDKVDTSLAGRREAKRGRFAPIHWGGIAASLALGLALGLRPWMPPASVTEANGTIVAAGPLAAALDTQLASSQATNAAVRIGLSFEDKAGRYCRSFESRSLDGIGCRDGGRWHLESTLQGQTGTEYSQRWAGGPPIRATPPASRAATRAAGLLIGR